MPRITWVETLETRRLMSSVLASVGSQPVGALTGKIVYASAGHGLAASSTGVWSTGRGLTNGMVEDLGTQDQLTFYADELWRAGATVVPMRPIGHQLNEVIVDDQQATYTGTWTANTTSTPYYSTSNGSGVHYRTAVASSTETAVATFTPNIPVAGDYPVYAWAAQGSTREADQIYRVNHAGGSTEVRINQTRVGSGWVYLGTYYFRAGEAGSVQVSNRTSGVIGSTTVADAIRFGNGMGDVVRNGLTSGSAREDEASLYWVEASAGWTGAGTRVSYTNWRTSTTSTDMDANVGAPLRWARYMNSAPVGQSLYLSFHSNASGGTGTQSARGGEGLYNDESLFPGTSTPNQVALATIVGEELRTDMTSLPSPPAEYAWYNNVGQTTYARTDYAFGEIRGDTSNYEFDATILEVAFHDNAQDAALMEDPVTRQRIAQATEHATVKYFAQFGGGTIAYTPERPSNLRTSADRDGNVTLNWDASVPLANFGTAATGYRVYASRDGYSFDGGQAVTGTALTIPKSAIGAGTVYFKVVATSAGGESLATAVVATRIGDGRVGRILIVDGFDRLGRAQDPIQSIAIGGVNSAGNQSTPVNVYRVRAADSNSYDYAVQHAQAIANDPSNIGVDTADNLSIINGNVNLANYRAVIWIGGEESTLDHTFSAPEQTAVTNYVNGGGKLMVSGAEIGWDLVAKANGTSFFNTTLHSGYTADDAGTYAASGVAGSLFDGIGLNFDDGTHGTYNVDYPDQLAASNGSTALLNYVGGTSGVAATRWTGANGAATVLMGFPFETITTAANRATLMRRVLDSFGFNTFLTPPPRGAPAGIPTPVLATVPVTGASLVAASSVNGLAAGDASAKTTSKDKSRTIAAEVLA